MSLSLILLFLGSLYFLGYCIAGMMFNLNPETHGLIAFGGMVLALVSALVLGSI